MPGSTSRPPASMPSAPRPWSAPTAPISRPAIRKRGFENLVAEQGPAAFDENVGHDAALRVAWLTGAMLPASYLSRKSSTSSLRKSGRARRSVSWSQSHHASSASRSGDRFRKPPLDRPRRIAGDDGVGGHVLGDDGAGRDHRAGADVAARQHDRAMADPDVMADMDVMLAPPCEELGVVALARKIGAGAIGEMRLRGAVHRMIAGIDPRHRRDRAEFSDRGVGDLRVVHDVGIVVHRRLRCRMVRAPTSHIGAELGVVQLRAWDRSVGSTESILPAMRTSIERLKVVSAARLRGA